MKIVYYQILNFINIGIFLEGEILMSINKQNMIKYRYIKETFDIFYQIQPFH